MSGYSSDDYNTDEEELEVITTHDYVTEAWQVIHSHDDITLENALRLNKQMQANLQALRVRLEQMLLAVQHKYRQNETLLSNASKVTAEISKARRTYYFCGYPYFKDRKAFGAPPPQDYAVRHKQLKELFPLRLEGRYRWTPSAKVSLIQAVKKQVITFLQWKNRDRIRALAIEKDDANATRADELTKENREMHTRQLSELFAIASSKQIQIDWFSISASALKGQYTMNECIGMWYGYLMPTINRSKWTPTEEDILLNSVNQYEVQNWPAIAQALVRRSPYQCFVHYHAVLSEKNMPKNVKWTKEEDAQLLEMVEKYRIGEVIPWTKIVETMPGRYKTQIYNRYMFSLNPTIRRDKFTVEEDCIIMAAVQQFGANFHSFPLHLLPGRNFVQIRNRYNNVLRHNGKVQHWTLEHDQKLVDLVERFGNKDWARIADQIQSHSRLSCRSRYKTIVNYLQQHPNSSVADVPRRKRKFTSTVTSSNWLETIIHKKRADSNPEDATLIAERERLEKQLNDYTSTPVGQEYYQYFKYSYNYKLSDADSVLSASGCERMRALSLVLGNNAGLDSHSHKRDSSYFLALDSMPQIKLEPHLVKSLRANSEQAVRLPPSLPTILGLRALTIMFENRSNTLTNKRRASEDLQATTTETPVETYDSKSDLHIDLLNAPDNNESILSIPSAPPVRPISLVRQETPCEAIQLFKRRFHQLFYTTALLANISPIASSGDRNSPVSLVHLPSRLVATPKKAKRKSETIGESATLTKRPANGLERVTNYTIETKDGVFQISIADETE